MLLLLTLKAAHGTEPVSFMLSLRVQKLTTVKNTVRDAGTKDSDKTFQRNALSRIGLQNAK